jgi:hypothetical protein
MHSRGSRGNLQAADPAGKQLTRCTVLAIVGS